MKKLLTTVVIVVTTCFCFAQTSSVQNLYFARKDRAVIFEKNDHLPGKNPFYIYRRAVYYLVLQNRKEIAAKITDIRNDSIYYTEFTTRAVSTDTMTLHPSGIRAIRVMADRIMGLTTKIRLRKYRYEWQRSDSAKTFARYQDTLYNKDSSVATLREVVPLLGTMGVDWLYQQCGKIYYYEGGNAAACEDTVKTIHPEIVKKWAWFTPSNANKIRGMNVGIQTSHIKDEPLTIKGMNLNADLLSIFLGCFMLFHLGTGNTLINMEDTIIRSNKPVNIRGVSLSFGGVTGDEVNLKGISVNGAVSNFTDARGVFITGTQTFIDNFHGLAITGLRSRILYGKGVQVGLLNVCKHLKGVQIGLWNINSKRKLPLINWDF